MPIAHYKFILCIRQYLRGFVIIFKFTMDRILEHSLIWLIWTHRNKVSTHFLEEVQVLGNQTSKLIWIFPYATLQKKERDYVHEIIIFFNESACWLLKYSWLRSGKWRAKKHFKLGSWINYGKSTGGIKVGLLHTKYKNTKIHNYTSENTHIQKIHIESILVYHMQCQYGLIRQYWMHKGRSRVHRVSTKLYGTAAIRNFQMFNAKTFTHLCILSHSKTCKKRTQ